MNKATQALLLSMDGLEPETRTWRNGAMAAGGTFEGNSIYLANQAVRALKATAFASDIIYWNPLFGKNLATARMPLIDRLGVGIATNSGFTNADFSQATGLVSTGGKMLDLIVPVGSLGAGWNGGCGYYELAAVPANGFPIVAYDAGGEDFGILYGTTVIFYYWGTVVAPDTAVIVKGRGNFYEQRAAANDRKLWLDGVQVASSAAVINSTSTAHFTALRGDANPAIDYAGACGSLYLTNGTLSGGEIAAFDTILNDFVITPTGR